LDGRASIPKSVVFCKDDPTAPRNLAQPDLVDLIGLEVAVVNLDESAALPKELRDSGAS
jgi:hypothetical protein